MSELLGRLQNCYRPQPQDDGRLCFHKNLSVNRGGGTPIEPGEWEYPMQPNRGCTPSSLMEDPIQPAGGTSHQEMMYPSPSGWMG